jgi:hypothetical protein
MFVCFLLGISPKENIQVSEHGENLKSRIINNGFLNTNSAITGELMGTARTVEGEWR